MANNMFDNKPSTTAQGAVAGTSVKPFANPDLRSVIFIDQMYDPDVHPVSDLHKYIVPQENGIVWDVPNGLIYRVAKVDWQATLKTTLVLAAINNMNENQTAEQDELFGLRNGPGLGEALLAVDYSVRPNVARADSTIMRPGASYALIIQGHNLDKDNGAKIISAQYDQALNMITNKVPVKLAEIVDRTNVSIMTTGAFSVTENEESLVDGSRCYLLFYDFDGEFIPPVQPLMVQHSSYMRDHRIGIKYVTEVELISPWFTNTADPERLLVSISINLLAVELRAVVHYSDGSKSDPMPVNGTKFNLIGLEEYRPTWPGQTAEVTLVYKLDKDEQHFIAEPGNPYFKRRTYTIQAGDPEGVYAPKLYTYPQWDATIGGYTLKHYLYDLDRKQRVDVSSLVTLNDKSPAWRPSALGSNQAMIFNINMRDVLVTNESVTFIQHTGITLYKDINGPGKRWEVSYSDSMPYFGGKVVNVKNAGSNTTFNLANGRDVRDKVLWLQEMYRAVAPSYDPRNEDKAPDPTHFDFMDDTGRKFRYPIDNYYTDNLIGFELQKGKTWFISWVYRDATGAELQLGLTGVVVEPV